MTRFDDSPLIWVNIYLTPAPSQGKMSTAGGAMIPAQDGTPSFHRMLGYNSDALLLRNRKRLGLLMSIQPYAFFDESGKWQDRDFICLCGYLSDESGWTRFLEQWKHLCARHGIEAIHMAGFYAEAGKKAWDETKAREVLQGFSAVVRDNILIGFAIGLDHQQELWNAQALDCELPKFLAKETA